MSIFSDVKAAVSCKDAAIFYGLKVGRGGFACCPFHNDRTPSMKLDNRYHCFGCGEDGDVIDYVSHIFGITNIEAAYKLCDDFGIVSNDDPRRKGVIVKFDEAKKRVMEEKRKEREAANEFNNLVNLVIGVLCDFHRYWWNIRQSEAPTGTDDEWSDAFCQALENTNKAEEWLIVLETGTDAEKKKLIDFLMGGENHGNRVQRGTECVHSCGSVSNIA